MSGNIDTREFSINDYDAAIELWQRVEGVEIAEGDRHPAVREQALHVIDAIRTGVDLDQAAERAAPDALRGEPVCLGVGFDDGQLQRQGHEWSGPRSGHIPGWVAQPNTPIVETTICQTY